MIFSREHLGNVGVGVTSPQFFRADDGEVYVVKMQNNRLGTKVLVSEFIGAKFGKIMGLCFPPSDIIEIDGQKHFASKYIPNVEYLIPGYLDKATNITEMAGVMLFDHMFHNKDRTSNRRNLLMKKEDSGYRIYAIDNSHLFKSGRWTAESISALSAQIKVYFYRSYSVLLRKLLTPADFAPFCEKVTQLTDRQIDDLIAEIPPEWLPNDTERFIIACFIKQRRDMVNDIVHILYKQIPESRGGLRWLNGKVIGGRKGRLKS